ncbi:beta galactosidase jelly roll domain-containing protein [Flexithrix dorotheae]|uniref:beta galactosidase jelly roll domain-containing protein n=1 Tax=Flexithrix dorotheae TaxID=70993 RepID=UPI000693A560|nr:beta galactosidase jelly roll domain-containing protein [Flexithrix dorotheae]
MIIPFQFVMVLLLFISNAGKVSAQNYKELLALEGVWKFSIGDSENWSKPNYNDLSWEGISVPSSWESQGYHGYDGFAWYRKHFDGLNLKRAENYLLMMGYIDDADEIYINGHLIGFSGSFPPHSKTAFHALRVYRIPEEFINFEGNNVIAVRVYDRLLDGGIIRGKIGIYTNPNMVEFSIKLEGIWSFKKGDNHEYKNYIYDDHDWDNVMVPLLWEFQIGRHYDGYGWYRKKFYLPKGLKDKELILVLGKIDDFDQTYVNGNFIGSTNDFRSFGKSTSYSKLRAYAIKTEFLKEEEWNVIAVRVKDIGHNGGIYEGPVGIFTREDYNKFWRNNY